MAETENIDRRAGDNPVHQSKPQPDANPGRRERHGNARLSPSDVRAIRADARPQGEIARQYGITRGNVSHIRSRRTWAHLADIEGGQ